MSQVAYIEGERTRDMEIFDKLPRTVRDALANGKDCVSAKTVYDYWLSACMSYGREEGTNQVVDAINALIEQSMAMDDFYGEIREFRLAA